jgi:hypothetical protein
MSGQAYVGSTKRTFQQAVLHLLETDYGLLGSQRVLELLANDVQHLVEQFYPVPEHLSSGWMVFTGTKADDSKPYPGRPAGDHTLVTLAWPVVLPQDTQYLADLPKGGDTKQARQALHQKRLIRIIEFGHDHPDGPVLLTQADLSLMLGLDIVYIGKLLTDARHTTGKPLLTKGYYFDQGMRPTHKDQIIALYEAGVDEADIAHQTQHSPSSVGAYIRDYERVKLLLSHRISVDRFQQLSGLQPGVIKVYVTMVSHYHPDLNPDGDLSPSQT